MQEQQQKETEHTYDNGFHPRKVILKDHYRFYNRTFIFLFFQLPCSFLTKLFFKLYKRIVVGYRVKGRKNFKKLKTGSVIISNHIHQLDAFFTVSEFIGKKMYISMLQSNLGFPIVSQYFRICGGVPIPDTLTQLKRFEQQTIEVLREKKKHLVVYAESALKPYCFHIRDFKKGAFRFAVLAEVPIVPFVYTFHKSKWRKKPRLTLNILEPYYIKQTSSKKETIETTLQEVHTIMDDFFRRTSDFVD